MSHEIKYLCRNCNTEQVITFDDNTTYVLCIKCNHKKTIGWLKPDDKEYWFNTQKTAMYLDHMLVSGVTVFQHQCPACNTENISAFDWMTQYVYCKNCQHKMRILIVSSGKSSSSSAKESMDENCDSSNSR